MVHDEEDTIRKTEIRAHIRRMFPRVVEPPRAVREDDEFISKADAMKMLSVSLRTLYRYMSRGKLRPCIKDGEHGIRREDVVTLATPDEIECPIPANRATFSRMHREVVQLRQDVDLAKRVLNMKWEPLELSAAQLVERYETAALLATRDATQAELAAWLDFLGRLRRDDLTLIESALRVAHPWIPFSALASQIRCDPRAEGLHEQSAMLASAAKQNVEQLVYVWLSKKIGFDALEQVRESLTQNGRDRSSADGRTP